MTSFKSLVILTLCLLAAGALLCMRVTASPSTQPARMRVGVYDSRAVAVAAVRSGIAARQVQELQEKLKEAETAGDEQRAEQVKKRGAALQTVRHLQGFSNAPIGDILAELQDRLPQIAGDQQVDLIVAHADYVGPDVETVDLTDRLVSEFNPDEQTMRIIASMRGKQPIDMVEVLMQKD